ncbi:hypothetical protein EIK77_008357 [Talaromyces pinophilus]|nr:hypothetical protein EIK77_008357 [Talaromyces pinophilus]
MFSCMIIDFVDLDIIAAFPNVTDLSELPTADLCSYCNVQKLAYMQGDAYTGVYDKNWESMYEYVAQTCGLLIDDFNATQSVFNVTVPSTPVNCVSGKMYTTNQGDTCDSIATKYGVSAATMFYTNPDIANCSSIIPGTNLCLPLSCTEIWSVQPNDTCTSIAIANSITPQNVLTYNSQLNSNCTNLHSTNPYWGSTLCVSTPGGTYTGQALNNTSTASQVVDPPLGATVAPGTTTDCGEWLVNEASPHLTCAQICLANGIAIKLFTQANPSLNKETCDSDLVVGNAYCVDPLTGWNWGINSTSTTTATSTTSSQTSVISNTATTTLASTTTTGDGISTPTPHQTGMASNCDRFYLVSSGDDCETIASNEGISLTDFYAWNPAVGTSCAYLDLNEYVCVLVIGATASATSTSTPTVPSNGIPTPTPYQTGMATNCDDFYLVVTNDECGTIATNHGITLSQFYQWNPAVGSSCQYLGLGDYVCVGVETCTSASVLVAPPQSQQRLTCGAPGFSHDNSGSLLITSYTAGSPYVASAAACGAQCIATSSCTNFYFTQGSYCNLHEGTSTFAESTASGYYLWYDAECFAFGNDSCGAPGFSHDNSGSLLITSYTAGTAYVESAAACGAQCLATDSCTNLYFTQGSYCNLHSGASTFAESTSSGYYSWYSASCFSSGQACGSYGFSNDVSTTLLVSYTSGSPYVASAAACGAQCLSTSNCTNVYFTEGSDCNLHSPSTFRASSEPGYYSWYQAGCFACDAYTF